MTEPRTLNIKKSRKQPLSIGQLCFGWFSVFCLLLILRNTEIAMEYMTTGLRLCVKTVIPSLFPFMVISELIVSGGIGSVLIRPFSPLFKKSFDYQKSVVARFCWGCSADFQSALNAPSLH